MIVFEGEPGRVVAFRDPAIPGNIKPLVRVEPELGFTQQRSIITRLTMSQQTSHQFMHTLGGDIYIYVFGDRIGQITISGLAFGSDCSDGEAANPDDEYGIERTLQWYGQNKLAARNSPVVVQLGRTPIRGFVTDMTADIVDPKTWISQYNLTLKVIPPREDPISRSQ